MSSIAIPEALLEQFDHRNILLFVGEGVNCGVAGEGGLPLSAELVEGLAKRCGYPDGEPLTLPRVARLHEFKVNTRRPMFLGALREQLNVAELPISTTPVQPNPIAPGASPVKRILFDQSHNQERWDWGPIPVIEEHGYRAAREYAEKAGYEVEALSHRITSRRDLANCDALVIVAPYHTHLQPPEIDAIAKFVENGKGLLLMSYYTGDPHHENNLSELGKKFGVEFGTDQVEDPQHHYRYQHEIVVEDVPQDHDILQGVHRLCLRLTCSLKVSDPAKVVLRSSPGSFTKEADVTDRGVIRSWKPPASTEAPLLAVANYGDGRFATIGTWEIFLSEYIESSEFSDRQLYLNLLRWLTASGPSSPGVGVHPSVAPVRVPTAVELRRLLTDHFDLEELRTLCFDLGVDYDKLRGEGQEAKARELVAYLERRDELDRLASYIRQHRPDIRLSPGKTMELR